MRSVLVILTIESFLYRGTDSEKIVTFISEKTGPTGTIGLFQSPGYPYTSTNENLDREYQFIGRNDVTRRIFERVQIRFEYINLYKKNSFEGCNEIDDSILSYEETISVLICGQRQPLPILSETNKFILRYKPKQPSRDFIVDTENSYDLHKVIGFNGTYRFVTNYGIDAGKQIPQNDCEFEFREDIEPSGSFSSPNFPGFYPKSKTCIYYFEGTSPYLQLNFTNFNLQNGNGDCRKCGVYSPYRDYVDLKATDSGDSQFFCERKCGSLQPFVVTVNASYFVVSFEASINIGDTIQFPSPEFVGFYATYNFTNSTVEYGLKIGTASAAIKIMTYVFVVVAIITIIIVVLIVMRTYLF